MQLTNEPEQLPNLKQMEFNLEGKCILTLDHKQGEKTSTHVRTDFNLEVSNNIDRSVFINNKDIPTTQGVKALTQCFVHGLIGNIHNAHQKGQWDSAEHLRYIISELENGFVAVANLDEGEFPDLKR